eukprot:scaffold101977_cov40-Tisochrysis_lutea.AAC.1
MPRASAKHKYGRRTTTQRQKTPGKVSNDSHLEQRPTGQTNTFRGLPQPTAEFRSEVEHTWANPRTPERKGKKRGKEGVVVGVAEGKIKGGEIESRE